MPIDKLFFRNHRKEKFKLKTDIIRLDIENPDTNKLKIAANVLGSGGIVAFPTETVYGLGANALSEKSVAKIYEAKGRPSDNPLIVHIAKKESLFELVRQVPDFLPALIERFWPGPLTIVLKKSSIVPDIITAGLDTVAVRMPSHPVALELIRLSGIPVAAPSANLSGRPSPTCAQHVIEDLDGRVDVIIDAGKCDVGLESTVLDLSSISPVILRPGGISFEELNEVIPLECGVTSNATSKPKAPGMKYTHYAPKAGMVLVVGETANMLSRIKHLAGKYSSEGINVGIMATEQTKDSYGNEYCVFSMGNRDKPETIAARLFATLRSFDETDVGIIISESLPEEGIGSAIMNRLKKAAGGNLDRV